ncbi:MAG: trehalase family glycosidase, partial [Bdellovibrionales bacterium]
QTPLRKESTLIPLPNPILIPGARFQEAYYWDSYFAMHALIRTGREKFVRGQIDNFLFLINKYGLVPNGNRDYYLSRSQPPLLSRMVRLYLHEKKDGLNSDDRAWLRNHVLPTLKRDYFGFWMNSGTRLHAATGLNHHWDAQNEPRPERHAADIEEQLGATYRDVRAEAESGRDFTAAYEGEATQTATVFLNALMYGLENDLAWFSELAGDTVGAFGFRAAMQKRKRAIQQHLYDPETDFYYHYNLREKRRLPYVTAEVFALVYFGVLTPAEGRPLVQKAMARLQATGGVMGSTIQSGKQWDAPFGWAPDNMIAIEALRLVGDQRGARHLARNWVSMVDRVFGRMGTVLEKYDMIRADAPEEAGDKYVTQQGFLWSNGVYVWILTDILKQSLVPL